MATAADFTPIIQKVAAYTNQLMQIPSNDYNTSMLIHDAIQSASQYSQSLLHLQALATLQDLQGAGASMKLATDQLKAQAKKISDITGKAAEAVAAIAIVTEIALAVAAL